MNMVIEKDCRFSNFCHFSAEMKPPRLQKIHWKRDPIQNATPDVSNNSARSALEVGSKVQPPFDVIPHGGQNRILFPSPKDTWNEVKVNSLPIIWTQACKDCRYIIGDLKFGILKC